MFKKRIILNPYNLTFIIMKFTEEYIKSITEYQKRNRSIWQIITKSLYNI